MGEKIKETEKGLEREREQNIKSTLMDRKLRNVSTLLAQINTFFQTVRKLHICHDWALLPSTGTKQSAFIKYAAFYIAIPANTSRSVVSISPRQFISDLYSSLSLIFRTSMVLNSNLKYFHA